MKKIIMVLAAVAVVTFAFSGGAYALSYYTATVDPSITYTGTYIFTVTDPKNDTENKIVEIEQAVTDWFSDQGITREVDFDLYSKVDAPGTSSSDMTVSYLTGNQDGYWTGGWTTDTPVEFYTVKGGDEFALYWIDGGADSGSWTTAHLQNNGGQQPAISHLSTWNPVEGGTTPAVEPVPEPGTIVLLGAGLFGLGCIIRRKKSK